MEFKEVVKQIEDVEKKVDKVLKAARLERHEKPPMTKDMLPSLPLLESNQIKLFLILQGFPCFFYTIML